MVSRALLFHKAPTDRKSKATRGSIAKRANWYHGFTIALTFISIASAASGQGFGSISGLVTDATDAAIPAVSVTATQMQTGAQTVIKTNSSGQYVFPSLAPAEYSISASATGFESYRQNAVTLLANQADTVNIQLKLGAASEVVTVSSEAVQVDTSTGTLSQVIERQSVNDLPLNGRNAAALTTLVAGVVSAPSDGTDKGYTKTFPSAVPISANGSRSDQTNYLLDGGNNLDEYTMANGPFPFPDALQEFSVQTSNYNAEYGQSAGAVVNIVTKSGGSSFHGDLFEYVRNGVFNARNYFATSVDPLKRNQFGGTIGGPARIPKLISGQHTFFFFGYQNTKIRDQQGGLSAYVPTQANLQGDFSALLSATNPNNPQHKVIQILDPTNGTPFANNQIPVGRLNASALAFAKDLPQSTSNGLVSYQSPLSENFGEYLARADHDLGTHDHIFAHYYYNDFAYDGALNTSNLLTYKDRAHINFQSSLISETHIFNSGLVNNFVLNYTHETATRSPEQSQIDMSDFGVKMWLPTQKALQLVQVTGFFSVGDAPIASFERNNYTLGEDLHWVKGLHNFSFGAHAELTKNDINNLYQQPGLFTFSATNTNYAVASFDLGYLQTFVQGNGQYFGNRATFLGFYAQDSWKMTRRFSLNYGVRYEPYMPYNEVYQRLEQFSPSAYLAGTKSTIYVNAPAGLLFPGESGVPEKGVNGKYLDFMPRLGFNWDPFGNAKTVIRGGGGTFYDTRQPGIQNTPASDVTPFSISATLTQPKGSFSDPYLGLTNPFPAPSPPPHNTSFLLPVTAYTFNPDFPVPVTYDWNLTVEQQLSGNMLARISYVGSHSTHLFTSVELNPATYIAGSKLGTDARRRYQNFANIVETNMGGNTGYHGLQAALQQRMSHGVTFLLNYTFAKALDNLPYASNNSFAQPGQSYVYPVYSPNFKSLDYGRSDFDVRHNVSASYLWTLPQLRGGVALGRAVLNGWATNGIVQIRSGQPLTITAGSDISGTGISKDRAQVVAGSGRYGSGGCTAGQACVNWIVPTAFALPTAGTFGNVQKGFLNGPGYVDWDSSLTRNFSIREGVRLEFRAEYFDLLNHTNLGAPVTAVTSAGFGSIKSSSDPRIAQLALKLAF
jgi:hypothetical protein